MPKCHAREKHEIKKVIERMRGQLWMMAELGKRHATLLHLAKRKLRQKRLGSRRLELAHF